VHVQEKALNPYGDCIICYEMNDQPLPRDHGFPLRMIVPGYAAVRNVKWLTKIELSQEEAEGPWQRGLNYKTLPPNVTDANQVNLRDMPSVMEASIFSGITVLEPLESDALWPEPGDVIMMRVGGWAWAGGGRKIVRVDATGDNCKNWSSAELAEGQNQKSGRAWAWTFWEAQVPSVVLEDGSVQVACKAVDSSLNVQPESCDNVWNVRGLGNNSWYRTSAKVR
jgi:sulfite oxidase